MVERRRKKVVAGADRVVRTFLFTDMVMSTDIQDNFNRALGETDGERKFDEIVREHDLRIEGCIGQDGEVVNVPGDAYVVAFEDARKAVECAVAIQRSFIANPIPIPKATSKLPQQVHVRVGLHTGVVKVRI